MGTRTSGSEARAGETDCRRRQHRAPARPYYFNIRLEDDRQCTFVVIGATSDGDKQILANSSGHSKRKSSRSNERVEAIKLLHAHPAGSLAAAERFRRGAEAFAPDAAWLSRMTLFGIRGDAPFSRMPRPVPCVVIVKPSIVVAGVWPRCMTIAASCPFASMTVTSGPPVDARVTSSPKNFTCSRYVPGPTRIVSPCCDELIASRIVGNCCGTRWMAALAAPTAMSPMNRSAAARTHARSHHRSSAVMPPRGSFELARSSLPSYA